MATKSLTFDIYGKDKSASKTIRGIGNEADNLGTRFGSVARGIATAGAAALAGLAVAGAAFAIESVKAFADSEEQQKKLEDAFERFPRLADTNIKAIRELNSALATKTRYDDDVIASGQSVLAQFELTGDQLTELTPLLLDYAAKTGKELPDAATDLGKALMGQGRALKGIGIDFQDTGTAAGNFDQLVAALRGQVGGFAEEEGTTAAGKLEILRNRFGEVQEKIGEVLMPALQGLMDWIESDGLPALEDFATWFTETGVPAIQEFGAWLGGNKDVLGPAAVAVGVLTAAVWLLNFAMYANPVTWFAVAAAYVIAMATAVTLLWDEISAFVADNPWVLMFAPLLSFAVSVPLAINLITRHIDDIKAAFDRVIGTVNGLPAQILGALGQVAARMFGVGQNMINGLIAGILAKASQVAASAVQVVNGAITAAKSALGIKSPSRVFADIGHNVGRGFQIGVEDMLGPVQGSVENLVAPPRGAGSRGTGAPAAGSTTTYNQTFNIAPIRDNDPVTSMTVLGREVARMGAG